MRTGKALPMQNGQRKFLKLTKAESTIAMRLFCFTVECTPTAGTAWECGYAYAFGKKVIVCCYNIEQTNLMIVNGCHAFLNGIDELSYYDFDKMPVVRNAGEQK